MKTIVVPCCSHSLIGAIILTGNLELFINATPKGVALALLKDKVLIELHREHRNQEYAVGDVYLGKVRKLVPHLNACFVDVGYSKDAFLHYQDLGPQFASLIQFARNTINGEQRSGDLYQFKSLPDIFKDGKIKDVIGQAALVPVQVAKEPISQKGPRLTSEITLAGRYLVLVPFSNKVSLSNRIGDEQERDRLRSLMNKIRPQNMGVIIRTQAEGTSVSELDKDLSDLVSRWHEMHKNLKTAKAPQRILGEINKTSSLLRDILNDSFSAIHVNEESIMQEIKSYLRTFGHPESIVKFHDSDDLFDTFAIHRQIKQSFGKQVNLKSGAYVIVEHTEAMHVIDVNSGNRKNSSIQNQEENALQTNIECAKEIARLLRLRDMGGIICIDFIDMQNKDNQRKLIDTLRDAMSEDKAKHNVLPPSKFGVVEITRERVKPVTEVITTEKCPSCDGKGHVQSSLLFTDEIENSMRVLVETGKYKQLRLAVHPMVEAYLNRGWFSSIRKTWSKKFKTKLEVKPNSDHAFLEYRFFDQDGEEIGV
jgi:ribonuclease G